MRSVRCFARITRRPLAFQQRKQIAGYVKRTGVKEARFGKTFPTHPSNTKFRFRHNHNHYAKFRLISTTCATYKKDQEEGDTVTKCSIDDPQQNGTAPKRGMFSKLFGFLDKDRTIAGPNFNRFASVPGSFLVQISIGSVYAFSMFNAPLTRELGVVAASAHDWSLGHIVPIFSTMAISLSLATSLLGPWAERVGPRKSAAAAGLAWSGGLLLSSIGVYFHSLPLLYIGYGALGGLGWGLGYISPVSNLLKWFPDRRGLATGLALTAFGGGAMLAAPIDKMLFAQFLELPEFLGTIADLNLITDDSGRQFVETATGDLQAVVVAGTADVAKLPVSGVAEGVYKLGTGSGGMAKTFATLSALYFAAIMGGAMGQRVPAPGWKPKGFSVDAMKAKMKGSLFTERSVHYNQAMRTPQFYLFWSVVFGNAFAGVTMISSASTMMTEIFGSAYPTIVTSAFAATFVASLSAGNMVGRLFWATFSDYIGRKNAYMLFASAIPIAASIPLLTAMASSTAAGAAASSLPLTLFYAGSTVIVCFYGGLFSVLPAYLADVFGEKHVGAIHGRALSAWGAAALFGPTMLTYLREKSYMKAVADLTASIDAGKFQEKFGAGKDALAQLVDAKTVTISKLMEIADVGTVDPSAHLYNSSIYAMTGALTVAVISNALIKPVAPHHFLPDATTTEAPKKQT